MAKATMPFYAALLVLSMNVAARAQEPARVLAELKYNPEHSTTLKYRGLRITLSNKPVIFSGSGEPDHYQLRVVGRYRNRPAFSMHVDDDDESPPYPGPTVRVMWLDRASALPQVVFTHSESGNCCNDLSVATMDAAGHWHVVETGGMLRDFEYEFLDLDGDGTAEIVSTWPYRYSSCWGFCGGLFPVTRIDKLIGRQLRDVSKAKRYRSFQRERLGEWEDGGETDSNGLLAGWVAQKALAGELSDAWRTMLTHYDHSEGNFPATLADDLLGSGYITLKDKRRLDLLNASQVEQP
jgi:hypothetical protein